MICVADCGKCKHQRNLLDGWRPCCDAFPDGIPMNFDFSKVMKIKECNNGIGFEEKESKQASYFALYRIFYRKGKVTPQIQLNAN